MKFLLHAFVKSKIMPQRCALAFTIVIRNTSKKIYEMASPVESSKKVKLNDSSPSKSASNEASPAAENDFEPQFLKEDYIAPKKEERVALLKSEYELIKNAGFFFNYENGVNSFFRVCQKDYHTVLANTRETKPFIDQWNDNYVKLPFSDFNVEKSNQKVWPIIVKSLKRLAQILQSDPDSSHIQEAIQEYRKSLGRTWNIENLKYLLEDELEGRKGESILQELFPKIINLALDLPNQIRQAIPILKSGKSHSISLSQQQCASILANAFFCTFPDRNQKNPTWMPFINFDGKLKSRLFSSGGYRKKNRYNIEKLKCILHYFNRITTQMPDGVITFSRMCMPDNKYPDFKNSIKPMRKPLIRLNGTIEDCIGALQVDFANKYIGGGVLNHGCVQEEIRFVICPELIVSLLFSERMDPNEAILIRGCERFSSYSGYGDTFEWLEDYQDTTARDEYNRIYTDILAIDALNYRFAKAQFQEEKIMRELKKCYCGFFSRVDEANKQGHSAIATGNWGCGAFRGDRQLKFLIQLIAASEAGRDIVYYTFNHQETVDCLNQLWQIIEKQKLSVGQVYNLIADYYQEIFQLGSAQFKAFTLLEYFKTKFSTI